MSAPSMDAALSQLIAKPIAHRGLHGADAPENSLRAVAAAINGGYAIEVDLRRTQDGGVVVFHDYDLVRMCGRSDLVSSLTVAQLSATLLRDGPETIPTLPSLLTVVGGRAPLFLELKTDAETDVTALVGTVVSALRGYLGSVALMSFDPDCVTACGQWAPQFVRGLVSEAVDDLDEVATRSAAAFVSLEQSALETDQAKAFRSAGAPLLAWTIQNKAQADRALRFADQITFEGFAP